MSIAVLFGELAGVKWDVIRLCEVRSKDEASTVIKSGHICCRGLADRRELGAGLSINKVRAGNIEESYSVIEKVAGLTISQ